MKRVTILIVSVMLILSLISCRKEKDSEEYFYPFLEIGDIVESFRLDSSGFVLEKHVLQKNGNVTLYVLGRGCYDVTHKPHLFIDSICIGNVTSLNILDGKFIGVGREAQPSTNMRLLPYDYQGHGGKKYFLIANKNLFLYSSEKEFKNEIKNFTITYNNMDQIEKVLRDIRK